MGIMYAFSACQKELSTAGLSSTIGSKVRGPSTSSSSSGPAAVYSSRSKPEKSRCLAKKSKFKSFYY